MSLLTKEQIFQADDLKSELVKTPEWGGEVYVRSLTGTDRDAFEQSLLDLDTKEVNLVNARSKLCALTIVDEKGKRLFSEADVVKLGKKNGIVLGRIYEVAERLSGLGKSDIKELVKNSKTAQSECSTLD